MFDALVKAVVDIDKRLVVVDAGLHSDQELYLMEHGSAQNDLWGINLWPENYGNEDFIEFDSLISLRPQQGNRSRGVDDPNIQKRIRALIDEVVYE
jgi:hypothetical protein